MFKYSKLTGLWFIIIVGFHSILVFNFKNQIVSVTNHNYYFMMNFCNYILWYFLYKRSLFGFGKTI